MLGAALMVVVQIAIGVAVNLYVAIPKHHPGSTSGNYFSRSFDSVVWAIGHGSGALIIHATLGLLLVLTALSVAIRAVRMQSGAVSAVSILGACFVVGAGFNGASFLDFGGQNISSLIMALLALGALSCYLVGLFLLPTRATSGTD